jgi:uncharacterized protein YjbI with pentapeptide repeats
MSTEKHAAIIRQGVEAWNAWRVQSPDVHPDLRGIDFNTSTNNLHSFQAANFKETTFDGCEVWSADLDGSDLRGSSFRDADVYFCDLTNVDLRGAEMQDARIRLCDLQGANLADATMGRTELRGIDLSKVSGLADVKHVAPTSIDAETLERTASGLAGQPQRQAEVEHFYRHAGMSLSLIDSLRVAIGHPKRYQSVFVSYSHADEAFASALIAALQSHGIRCWLDKHEMLPGDRLFDAIHRGIRESDRFLLCCSRDSLTSWWVDNEVEVVLQREQQIVKREGRQVSLLIPLDLDGYIFSEEWASGKAAQIRARVATDVHGWNSDQARFSAAMSQLTRSLSLLDTMPPIPEPPPNFGFGEREAARANIWQRLRRWATSSPLGSWRK